MAMSTPRRLTDKRLLELATKFARLAGLRKRCERERGEAQEQLLAQLELRGARTLSLGDTTITRAQQDPTVTFDQDALWADLQPAQRRVVFDDTYDLNALPAEIRARFVASLGGAEKKAITRRVLNAEALLAEVASHRIPAAIVDSRRTVTEKAPYIVVTGAPAN